MTPPLITIEEHWYSNAVYDSLQDALKQIVQVWPGAYEKLLDAGDIRLRDMDKGKVSLQVVSHCTADEPSPEVCRAGNDQLAMEIRKSETHRKRFAGFALLPLKDPEAAAAELERTVKQHGFVGALVDHKAGNAFCDGENYDALWEKSQELDVPIYLHPSWPTDQLFLQSYAGNYSHLAAQVISSPMWGGHSEVGLHVVRLFAAGVFDRYPKLKIILGHFGEMVPFMLQRIQNLSRMMNLKRDFLQVWGENFWITTSACWSVDPMRCILSNTKVERIMYSVDYPFTSNEAGLKWITDLEESGLVTKKQLDLIAYQNAENLLGVKAPVQN